MPPRVDLPIRARRHVPLTGREPLVGALRQRLRARSPGAGWLTLLGPPGSGVTRLLEECTALLAEEGVPPPLLVRPCEGPAAPFAALRTALLARFGTAGRAALARSLRTLFAGEVEGDLGLDWLFGREGHARPVPTAEVVRAVVAACAGGAPVLVDAVERLDAGSLDVLVEGGESGRFGVVAGTSRPDAARGTVWAVEPLREAQVTLLLRRWLRDPVTARDLAPDLWRRCEGWPGRVVLAVRALAAHTSSVVTGANERRVLEVAAVHGGPLDPAILAAAARVKRAVVDGMLAAAANGPGTGRGSPFPDAKASEAFLQSLPPTRRAEVARRLGEAWLSSEPAPDEEVASALDRLRAMRALGNAKHRVAAALHLARLPAQGADREALDALLDEVASLGRDRPVEGFRALAIEAIDLAIEAGRPADAFRVLRLPLARRALDRRALPEATRLARMARIRGRPLRAVRRLAAALRAVGTYRGADAHRARVELALSYIAGGPQYLAAAREALRTVLGPPPASGRTGLLAREALADVARRTGRPRAACAHLRRLALALRASGDVRSAARISLEHGRVSRDVGRLEVARAAFEDARRAYRACGERAGHSEALVESGRLAIAYERYDEAVALLEAGLDAARGTPSEAARTPSIHLDLAAAYEGRGLPAAAVRHAMLAGTDRAGLDVRLRADLVQTRLVAEAAAARRIRRDADRVEFERVARDANAPVHVRAEAYARLACAWVRLRRPAEAADVARAAASLLEVADRSRAQDARVHRILAGAFAALGERGRAGWHRSEERRLARPARTSMFLARRA